MKSARLAPVPMRVIAHVVLGLHSVCVLYLQQLQTFNSSECEVMRTQCWHCLSQALALGCGGQCLRSFSVPWHESGVSLGPSPLYSVFSDLLGTLAQSPFLSLSRLPNLTTLAFLTWPLSIKSGQELRAMTISCNVWRGPLGPPRSTNLKEIQCALHWAFCLTVTGF